VVPQPRGSKLPRFGLFPVRSPLLGESRLISVPPGTEMFQFSGLAPLRVTSLAACRVSPFGHSGIDVRVQLPRTYRSLPRPSSPLDAKASTVCLIAFDLNLCVSVLIPHTSAPGPEAGAAHPSSQLSKSGRQAMRTRGPKCGRISRSFDPRTRRAYSMLQKGGDPAAGSPTATLLRLRPSH
jgi:hypothetical protein